MFYLPQAILTWAAAVYLIEWKRIRKLFVYGASAAFLCSVQDRFGLMYHLWEYRDTGPVDRHIEISILIGLSAAPLFGIYFVQGLRQGSQVPVWRIVGITAVALLPETIGLYTGRIVYGGWWNYGWSVLAHLLLWLGFCALHRWLDEA